MAYINPFMQNTQVGTAEDDILISGLGNDTLIGLEGNDTLFGSFGSNLLNGGSGDDLVVGGLGDDLMIGGLGNDILRSSAGNDTMDGGAGNDLYYIAGAMPGGQVLISDLAGNDTIDAHGATTSALIDLNPGESSYVDGREIIIEGGESVTRRPLDLVLTQDLSGSFGGDLVTMRGLIDDLVARIEEIAPDARLGATSYVDKPLSPFGASSDYEYITDLGLTDDFDAFTDVVNGWRVLSGADGPESQLTALLQLALRTEEVGWRDSSLKVVLLTTDANYHQAGDASSLPPNNLDTVLDGDPPGSGEDYPSVAQVRDALSTANIIPVFAVTSGVTSIYESLVSEFGFGAVVSLAGDSSNIIEVFEGAIETSTTSLIEAARGGDHDDEIIGNDADNFLSGRDGDDSLYGGLGDDTLAGGNGEDSLVGGDGDDVMYGNNGNDRMFGGNGNDFMSGGNDDDLMAGGAGDDTMEGGNGDDTLYGNSGDDVMDLGNGNDWASGGDGNDWINGHTGNNTIRGGNGDDTIYGGVGDDLIAGNNDNDEIHGVAGDNRMFGGAGNDTIHSGSGTDTMYGGADADVFVFSSVSDSAHGAMRDTIADFEAGVDRIDLSGLGSLTFVAAYTGSAGEVRYNDAIGRLYVDIDGDMASDFSVDLLGTPALTEADLIL